VSQSERRRGYCEVQSVPEGERGVEVSHDGKHCSSFQSIFAKCFCQVYPPECLTLRPLAHSADTPNARP
jgi:hypothetical protein